ncbi:MULTISPECIES: flagellar basal body P-ring formation chaperone FlgA [unclassified Brenneria]|uniref:flagellar basal body P-ring formation chaperone FlgA n=1 Tax=unclassified Brenneria TaxID=2634434 RepID=UPI001552F6C1|nr:flagellar basal body P-ring formation chaperone FlgA [Brenneria sp. hezel4-2-4]MEE3649721.1 flagellar basal body P-ring formation chaperone FlgA [Brenneria sp. HEZEL_4_2_4]NPC99679.1 flagellar basal body P-ring formation protein FlgA [Brenneria sp. hezel4-2-4]
MGGNRLVWFNVALALLAVGPAFASEPYPKASSSQTSSPQTLSSQIETFIRQQITIPVERIDVKIKTPNAGLPDCAAPQFALPSRNKIWGNLSIRVTCGSDRYFIQTSVQVTGEYLVTARPIPPKHKISVEDIKRQRGRLDTLATIPVTEPGRVLGSVSQRMIGAGQPLQERMFRQPWAVKSGQTVQVIASGDGFNISSEGKVMNNAVLNDKVRVRMNSGQIVNGSVEADGTVKVAL